jgi:hypothetical protein
VAGEVQFWIQPRPDGYWWVLPERETLNQTMINGRAILSETPLQAGDRLAVGNESKGVERHVVVVELEPDSRGVGSE